jgi:[acyl-carrier-protein] S-malonyltransferase
LRIIGRMTGRALLFPGQGVQAPGMGERLWTSPVFDEASESLGADIVRLCRDGDGLASTRWAQPAIAAVGVAAAFDLEERSGTPDAVAGHSLGEYAALIFAGALSVGDGLRLVATRAQITERAASGHPGCMAAVLGLERDQVLELCGGTSVVLAADNAPGQLVVSGPTADVDNVLVRARQAGAKGASRLDVAGAFHSPAMSGAVPEMRALLEGTPMTEPRIAYWSSVDASPLSAPSDIRARLAAALTHTVEWRRTVLAMAREGLDRFVDAGPGRVLANLVKRISRGVRIETAEEVAFGARV